MSQQPSSLGKRPPKRTFSITWRGVVLVVIGILLVVFAFQNLQTAPVNFLGAQMQVWVWLLVIGTFLLGMLLGGMVRAGARKLRKPKPPQVK